MTYISDEQRRVVSQQRLANGLFDDYLFDAFNGVYDDVLALIMQFESNRLTNNKLIELQKQVEKVVAGGLSPAWSSITKDLGKYGLNESIWLIDALSEFTTDALRKPSKKAINKRINDSLLNLGSAGAGLWPQFIEQNIDGFANRYNRVISRDYAARKNQESSAPTLQQTAKSLKQINTGLGKSSAEALVRTGINHYATESRLAVRDENKDIIAREVPFVTFDNRTTDICISINAKYASEIPMGWPVGKSPIGYPPYHVGCRTVILFMTKGQQSLQGSRLALGAKSTEQAREDFENRKDRLRTASQVRYRGKKDLNIFEPMEVAATQTFSGFLREQPDYYIYDTLGKTKGQLFIDGKLDLKRLTDVRLKPLKVGDL